MSGGGLSTCLVLMLMVLPCSPRELPPEAYLTTAELVRKAGNPAEEHQVKTSDGYVLKAIRIPGGRDGKQYNPSLPPVVLVHGFVGSSRDYVLMGPERSLGFLLANDGYDVWLPNMRFTRSATHITKSKQDPSYWDFSFEEHGKIDIPETIDYILNVTQAQKVHYLGYSMGTLTYIIMCDERPDLAKRMASYIGLAPAVYLANLKPLVRIFDKLNVMKLLRDNGIFAIGLNKEIRKFLATNFCSPRKASEDICFSIVYLFTGEDFDQVDWDTSPAIFNRFEPCSIKQLEHFLQLIRTDTLAKFDYGVKDNMIRYGSAKPPKYNMTANMAPVILYYGENDKLTTYKDVNKLANVYRSTNTLMSLRKPKARMFNHIDFIYAKNVSKLLNVEILKLINFISNGYIRYRGLKHQRGDTTLPKINV